MILIDNELPKIFLDNVHATISALNYEYLNNKKYAMGKNPTILSSPEKAKPDNRVPVPFAKKAISTLQGYATKSGYITYSSQGDYISLLKEEVLDFNDEELLTSELFADMLTAGYSYEILRMDENLMPRMYRVSPGHGVMVYDNTLSKNEIAFVHLERQESVVENRIQETEYMTIYYSGFFVEYIKAGSKWAETNRQRHPFGGVPVIKYVGSSEGLPVFETVKAMIDEHDKIISSDYANEMERFANAYLLLAKEIAAGDLETIKDKRIFQGLKQLGESGSVSDSVAFLTKPSRGTDIAEASDRFERLIYEMMMVINPADKEFGTASGIALAYKILPMEWLTASIMSYFTKGLQKRFELLGNAMRSIRGITPETITIHERRNLPLDLATIAQVAGTLKGILSDKTIIGLFPADVVPDPSLELERLESAYTLGDEIDSTNAD